MSLTRRLKMNDIYALIDSYTPRNKFEEADKHLMLKLIKENPTTILTRKSTVAHVTASGFILNKKRNKVLMIHHNIYNSWGWTGGHADGNPNLLEVALKEAREETGLNDIQPLDKQIAAIDILPVFQHMKNSQPFSAHLHLNITYLLSANEEDVLTVKPDENSAVAWIPIDQISNYCHEAHMIPIYKKLIDLKKALY